MTGELLAFPMSRHGKDGVSFVNAVAARMAVLNPISAEKHLARQLDRKTSTLRRRGFDDETIKTQRTQTEAAIRDALWRRIFQGGAV
jgi:hypothetical protein